jgi:hypothetical protein
MLSQEAIAGNSNPQRGFRQMAFFGAQQCANASHRLSTCTTRKFQTENFLESSMESRPCTKGFSFVSTTSRNSRPARVWGMTKRQKMFEGLGESLSGDRSYLLTYSMEQSPS